MGALLFKKEHGFDANGNAECDSRFGRKGFVFLTAASEKGFL